MSAPWWQKSGACWAVGCAKTSSEIARQEKSGRCGNESRRRPILLCARRATTPACGQDRPAPSINRSPRPSNRSRVGMPVAKSSTLHCADHDVGTTTDPQADVVIGVVGIVVVAIGGTEIPGIVVPRTAPNHPRGCQATLRANGPRVDTRTCTTKKIAAENSAPLRGAQ